MQGPVHDRAAQEGVGGAREPHSVGQRPGALDPRGGPGGGGSGGGGALAGQRHLVAHGGHGGFGGPVPVLAGLPGVDAEIGEPFLL